MFSREICKESVPEFFHSCEPFFKFRTSGENIGDSGLIQSYRAWQNRFSTTLAEGREYLLPGLNYTRCVFGVPSAFNDF